MDRKLCTIQCIDKIVKHPNADTLSIATILGWQVVIKTGEFSEGHHVIYCEVGTILPEKPAFEFLRDRKFRIRTIKIRGAVSQGICFPIEVLEDFRGLIDGLLNIGTDVTVLIGATK